MKNKLWVNLTTAPRDQVEACFLQQRDEIMMRIIRFQGEMESYNSERFSDNPIIVSMDFTEQLDKYLGMEEADKRHLYNKAFDTLMELESGAE
jgi:hypothetical protein